MAREITYTILVDDTKAKADVAAFEREVAGVSPTTTSAAKSIEAYDKSTVALIKSQTQATTAIDGAQKTTRIATSSITDYTKMSAAELDAIIGTTGALSAQAPVMSTVAVAADTMATAEGAAAVSTATLSSTLLGLAGPIGIAVIATQALAEALEWLIRKQGELALASETAAAKQDVIDKAFALSGKVMAYGDAVKYVNDQFEHMRSLDAGEQTLRLTKQLSDYEAQTRKTGLEQSIFTQQMMDHGIVVGQNTDIQDKWKAATERSEAAAKQDRLEHDKLTATLKTLGSVQPGLRQSIGTTSDDVEVMARRAKALAGALDEVQGHSSPVVLGLHDIGEAVPNEQIQGFVDRLLFVGPTLDMLETQATKVSSVFKNLGRDIVGAFAGGGDVGRTIGSSLGEEIGTSLSEKLSKGAGKFATGMLSFLGPGLSLIGGLVGGAMDKLFHTVEKQVNRTRQAFVDASGGLETLNVHAYNAGITLDHLLDARTPEAYKAAIDELNAAFQFQDQAMQTLDDTIAKYGLDLSKLGPAYDKNQLDKKAQELFQDWSVLHAAGIDQVEITQKMGGSVSEWLQKALAAGIEIPQSMKPMLQNFADMGDLVDANGNKITDLSQIPFAETMSQGFDRVVTAVQKLIDAITRGLNPAIADIPDPEVTGHVHWEVDSIPSPESGYGSSGGLVTAAGIQHLASGGIVLPFRARGIDTVPAMLAPGEGVVNRRGMASLGRSGLQALNRGQSPSGGVTMHIQQVQVVAAPGDDPKALSEKFIAALRTESKLYESVSVVARRAVA